MTSEHVYQLWMDTYFSSETNMVILHQKTQYSPHRNRPIDYGGKQKIVQPTDTSPSIDDKGINIFQCIVGALLYVRIEFNNKLLVALSNTQYQQSGETEDTADAIQQLIDYVATYPDNDIIFRKIDMILEAHAHVGFLNESKARSRAGAHIFLSENDPKAKLNDPVLTIAQIIKNVMTSAAEAKMAALYITDKKYDTTTQYTH